MTLQVFHNQTKYGYGVFKIGEVHTTDTEVTDHLLEIIHDLLNYEVSGAEKVYYADMPAYRRKGVIFVPNSHAKGICNADFIVANDAVFHVCIKNGWKRTEDLSEALGLIVNM